MSKSSRGWKEFMKEVNPLRKNRTRKMYLTIKKRMDRFDKQQNKTRIIPPQEATPCE